MKIYDVHGNLVCEIKGDLIAANLTDLVLDNALFDGLTLQGAHFDGSYLRHATFRQTDLYWATFFEADLSYADLTDADLRGADLSNARLFSSTLKRAKLGCDQVGGSTMLLGTDFRNANIEAADFTGAKFDRRRNFRPDSCQILMD
jgi:uncharacterized protein YjbI with pentapeptide repeats